MANFTLRQGDVIAKLSQVCYRPDEGFQGDNTWHVAEASISADSDKKLADGSAIIEHEGKEFPVTVSVLECETPSDEEDEEPEWANPFCTIEISCAEGLPKLALALGLL